jgi:hypothetical protein
MIQRLRASRHHVCASLLRGGDRGGHRRHLLSSVHKKRRGGNSIVEWHRVVIELGVLADFGGRDDGRLGFLVILNASIAVIRADLNGRCGFELR